MKINELDQAIKAVCPIDGISFGKLDDPATWTIQYNPTSPPTPEQEQAALSLISSLTSVDDPRSGEDPVQVKLDELQAKIDALQVQVDVVEGKVDTAALIEPK